VLLTTYLESQLADLKEACKNIENLHGSELARRQDMQNQMDILNATLENSYNYNKKVKIEAEGHMNRSESRLEEKNKDISELQSLVKPLSNRIAELQDNYTAQTKEYNHFVSRIRSQQQQADHEMNELRQTLDSQQQVCKNLRDQCMHLTDSHKSSQERHKADKKKDEAKIGELHSKIRDLEEQVTVLQENKQNTESTPEKSAEKAAQRKLLRKPPDRIHGRKSKNICKELRQARDGIIVEFVDKKSENVEDWKLSKRFLRIDPTDKILYCYRLLHHEVGLAADGPRIIQQHFGDTTGQQIHNFQSGDGAIISTNGDVDIKLELKYVVRIDYSCYSVPAIQCSNGFPWLGFSLYTVQGSHDFVCSDENAVRCLVLVLSRLCLHASGTFKSRAQFEAAKGWCKLEDSRLRHGAPAWPQVLLKALRSRKLIPGKYLEDGAVTSSSRSKSPKGEKATDHDDIATPHGNNPRTSESHLVEGFPTTLSQDVEELPIPMEASDTKASKKSKMSFAGISNMFKNKRRTRKGAPQGTQVVRD